MTTLLCVGDDRYLCALLGESASRTYMLGPLRFASSRNEVTNGLTRTESKIPHVLVLNAGHVVTPVRILERVWGYNAENAVSVVKTHMHNLRSKIARVAGTATLIQTVGGAGYMCPREARWDTIS